MALIFHIVVEDDLRRCCCGDRYAPDSLRSEGFVHCADEAALIAVANDYYASVAKRVLVLKIDAARLGSEMRREAPAPRPGGGTEHLHPGATFPHVYGAVEIDAVVGAGELSRANSGRFAWPSRWLDGDELRAFLSR